jgi:TonB family protein
MNIACFSTMLLLLFGTRTLPARTLEDSSAAIHVADALTQEQQKKKTPAVIEDLDEQPTPIKTASPVYPKTALKDSLEGSVFLRVTIDEQGGVAKVEIEKGTRDDLNAAAIDAMKQWKFKPLTRKGTPVQASVVVPFRFRLTKEKK